VSRSFLFQGKEIIELQKGYAAALASRKADEFLAKAKERDDRKSGF